MEKAHAAAACTYAGNRIKRTFAYDTMVMKKIFANPR